MILSYDRSDVNLDTSKDVTYNLALGQAWERILADNLNQLGFRSEQPRQRFLDPDTEVKASIWALRGRPDRAARVRLEGHRASLLRPLQLDLVARLGKVRFHIEVKALTPRAFQFAHIHVGCCPKFDLKRLDYNLVLINQATGESWLCPEKSKWSKAKSKKGSEIDYVVSRADLVPLGEAISYAKDMVEIGLWWLL